MNKSFSIKFIFIALAMLFSIQVSAQDREFIRNKIQEWGECRNVAITKNSGSIALYGEDGFAYTGCPEELVTTMNALNGQGLYLDDIQITEGGSWLILVDNNEAVFKGIPASLKEQIEDFNKKGESINSVTFNDEGDWIIISENYVVASDDELTEEVLSNCDELGNVWAACITNDAMVIVYEKGYHMAGEVPATLEKGLDESGLDVYRLKIAGDAWFVADEDGNCKYHM